MKLVVTTNRARELCVLDDLLVMFGSLKGKS